MPGLDDRRARRPELVRARHARRTTASRARVHAALSRPDAPAPRRPRAARGVPRPRTGARATGTALRRAGAPRLPALRHPGPRVPAPALRRLRARCQSPSSFILASIRWVAALLFERLAGFAPKTREPDGAFDRMRLLGLDKVPA